MNWYLALLIGFTCIAASSGWSTAADAPTLPPPTKANIAYGTHERHVLDLWQADGESPRPLCIFIHGGGWHGGDKADAPPTLVAAMLKAGISTASINYRFTRMAKAPAPLYDAARAVQHLRKHAVELNLDPQHFAGYGISAGGVSTLWLVCHDDLADAKSDDPVLLESSRLQTGVALSPPVCLELPRAMEWVGPQLAGHLMMARAVGAASSNEVLKRYAEFEPVLRECSPLTHVSRDDGPTLISFPRVDPLPAETPGSAIHHAKFGEKFQEAAQAVGMPCVLRIEDRAGAELPTTEEFLVRELTKAE
ncbi:MAG: alpha/beta hydrolase [Pirellulales bacterium]